MKGHREYCISNHGRFNDEVSGKEHCHQAFGSLSSRSHLTVEEPNEHREKSVVEAAAVCSREIDGVLAGMTAGITAFVTINGPFYQIFTQGI